MQTIKPRERLIKYGVDTLSDEELLAILIQSGSQSRDVFGLSKDVMQLLYQTMDLKQLRYAELIAIKGIKTAKAATILAAIELGVRLIQPQYGSAIKLHTFQSIYDVSYPLIGDFRQEHLLALFLNTKGILIHKEIVFKGTLNQTLIHPRELFHVAVKVFAHAIIIVHNHPSGDVNPSFADIDITRHMMESGQLLGIEISDHIIIARHKLYSIKHKKEVVIVV